MLVRKPKPKTNFQSWSYLICALLILLFIPVWTFWISPQLRKIPDDFTYSADILSIDNFYDEKINKYEGEHISKTIFYYVVSKKNSNFLTVKNTFNVSKLSNIPIFSVTRLYYINPLTGEHASGANHKKRNGYLFAPRYVNKNDFIYWHINYDAPALLKYVDTEEIDGLSIYHYQTHYSADQTVDLGYLPGVPEKRGVKTDIDLQLWIEPISGWLIKYQDRTLAYFYDKKTGKFLSPWNQFSNRYTQNSINKQVSYAKRLKWKILMIDFGVPILSVMVASLLLILAYFKKRQIYIKLFIPSKKYIRFKKYYLATLSYLILIIISIGSIYYIFFNKPQSSKFIIGISKWNESSELFETISGFKKELAAKHFIEEKNIDIITKNSNANIENQINIIQSFINNKVDLIYTLTTPGTLIAEGISAKTPIVFSNVIYPEESNIISSVKSSKNNVVGISNYIPAATQFYYFERLFPDTKSLAFIHRRGDPDSEILLKEYRKVLYKRGINIIEISAIDLDDLKYQLEQQKNFNAIFSACDTLLLGGGDEIVAQYSRKNKIPSFSCDKNGVIKGNLIGYTANPYLIGQQAGNKAALILTGADPSWLRTESPNQGLLIINLSTAQLLGITIPADILQEANILVRQ